MSLSVSAMSNTRSFYGSATQPDEAPPDWLVQSWVPNDGLDSDDPDWMGGDDGDLSSGSDWYADGKRSHTHRMKQQTQLAVIIC